MKTNRTLIALLMTMATVPTVFGQSRLVKSADRDEEVKMTTSIEVDFGVIKLEAGDKKKLFQVDAIYNPDIMDPELKFKRSDISAKLDFSTNSDGINMGGGDGKDDNGKSDFTSTILLGKAVSHDLTVSLGAGSANLNLTGLSVSDFNLSNGAGSVKLVCDSPNPESIRTISINSGVGEIDAKGLLNLNFRKLNVENGVGQITLDFTGQSTGHKKVSIETGIGEIKVLIPPHVGVMVQDDSGIFSNLSVPKSYSQDENDFYFSSNYETAETTIEFEVSTGIGNVRFVALKNR